MLIPESNIHSFKVASASSVIEEPFSITSRSASKPSPVRTSVAEIEHHTIIVGEFLTRTS